jgi:hypothetical protein
MDNKRLVLSLKNSLVIIYAGLGEWCNSSD